MFTIDGMLFGLPAMDKWIQQMREVRGFCPGCVERSPDCALGDASDNAQTLYGCAQSVSKYMRSRLADHPRIAEHLQATADCYEFHIGRTVKRIITSLILLACSCCIAAEDNDLGLARAHIQLALNALMTGDTKLLKVDQDSVDQALSYIGGSKDQVLKDSKEMDLANLNERIDDSIQAARNAYPKVSDLSVNAFLMEPDGRAKREFQVSLTGEFIGKTRFFQMQFDSLKTDSGWMGHFNFRFHQTVDINTIEQLEEDREFFKELYRKERTKAVVRAKGRISCNYGNRGGSCDIDDSLVTYSFGLSAKNDVDWYFEDVNQPTTKLPDTDIVIPTFETQALTHFQDCSAEVLRHGDQIVVRITLEGCAHSKEIYEPALNATAKE